MSFKQDNSYPEINEKRILSRLMDLCRIPGPSGSERPVAEYVKSQISKINGHSDSDERILTVGEFQPPSGGDCGNLLFRVDGKGPGGWLLLSAHLDTVSLPVSKENEVFLIDGILRTDGNTILGGDDRSGVVAALEILELASAHPEKHGGIEVLFTVQEEMGCIGSRNLDRNIFNSKLGYNLDGETPPGSIIRKATEKRVYNVEVKGKASHAALAPEKGVSALKAAAGFISKLPQGRIDLDTTANTGFFSSGGRTNVIPATAEIVGEVRSFSEKTIESLCRSIDRLCENFNHKEESDFIISWKKIYSGYFIESNSPSVERFQRAALKEGIEPELLSSPGGGDSNNLNALGIENVVFGLGMHDIHTPGEFLIVEELILSIRILRNIIFSDELF